MDEHAQKTLKRMEGYFRHQLKVACDISLYIDLTQAITKYLLWMESNGYSPATLKQYQRILYRFLNFIKTRSFSGDAFFTALTSFKKAAAATDVAVIVSFARYLYPQKTIPIKSKPQILPDVLQKYLDYRHNTGQMTLGTIRQVRRILCSFYDYLKKRQLDLQSIEIQHIDTFLAQFNKRCKPSTCSLYRYYLRGFLAYLYQPCGMLRKNLAPLVVGPPMFAKAKPPKFLRSHEIKRLFDSLNLSSPTGLRNYAMIHLAYYLGLRPAEISQITFDDILFAKSELAVKNRKNTHEIALPLPENTLKATVAYIVGARPKSNHRTIFVTHCAPYRPISAGLVRLYIKKCIQAAGLCGSAYWLRHTYAQNLLEAGASIYEIKEMLGHQRIDTTRIYISIHIELMRKVLFDETL